MEERYTSRVWNFDYTSVLDANAYGAKGVYRMRGTHKFKKVGDKWLSTNK